MISAMLLGLTGSGKSMLGNALLGLTKENKSKIMFNVSDGTLQPEETLGPQAEQCYLEDEGISLRIIDTPGIFDTEENMTDRWVHILKALKLANGSLDALIIVINLHEAFFANCVEVMKTIMERLEISAQKVLVVFTNFTRPLEEDKILTKFNTLYKLGSLGMPFVFSDQTAPQKDLNDARKEIIGRLKRISKLPTLTKKDFTYFCEWNLECSLRSYMKRENKELVLDELKLHSNFHLEIVEEILGNEKIEKAIATVNKERSYCIIL